MLGAWEVGEGWADGDVQRESMPGFLTTTQVLNKAFKGPFRQQWAPLWDVLGIGTRGRAGCHAQSLFGVCPHCVQGGSPKCRVSLDCGGINEQ